MRIAEKRQLEDALREHFRRERLSAEGPAGHVEAVATLAAAETAQAAGRDAGTEGLVRAVIRFSPHAFWVAPVAVVLLALALALSGAPAHEAQAALVASGPALVAACLVGVVRARSCLMQEIEASCLHNAASVACVRLIVFGGATILALAFACIACSAIIPTGAAVAYALAPCLVSAAGGFMLARKASSTDASVTVIAWSAGVCALCLLLRVAVPVAYEAAMLWAWAVVSAAGAMWCAREVLGWLRFCAQGGIAPEDTQRAEAF